MNACSKRLGLRARWLTLGVLAVWGAAMVFCRLHCALGWDRAVSRCCAGPAVGGTTGCGTSDPGGHPGSPAPSHPCCVEVNKLFLTGEGLALLPPVSPVAVVPLPELEIPVVRLPRVALTAISALATAECCFHKPAVFLGPGLLSLAPPAARA